MRAQTSYHQERSENKGTISVGHFYRLDYRISRTMDDISEAYAETIREPVGGEDCVWRYRNRNAAALVFVASKPIARCRAHFASFPLFPREQGRYEEHGDEYE